MIPDCQEAQERLWPGGGDAAMGGTVSNGAQQQQQPLYLVLIGVGYLTVFFVVRRRFREGLATPQIFVSSTGEDSAGCALQLPLRGPAPRAP